MKKLSYLFIAFGVFALAAFTSTPGKLVSKNAHISFYSHTALEDITANNYKVVTTLDPATGDVVFSVPMQSFEFEKALMQEHFNGKDFLNTKNFPKAKFVGKILNLSTVNFEKDGSYEVSVSGELTIKDTTKPLETQGTITVKEGTVTVDTKFNVTLADYGITFKKGKPSTNVAKEVEARALAEYLPV